MMRLIFLFLLISLVGCATRPPQVRANACSLLREKGEWIRPLDVAAKKWKIPTYTILSIIYHESKFIHNAKPPLKKSFVDGLLGRRISSAYGYSQALDATWLEYVEKTKNWAALRSSFEDSVDFIGWYLNRSVKRLGISRYDAYKLYLAYHEGNTGFKRGSYKNKPAIKNYARQVQTTALSYKKQMMGCS